MRNTKLPFIERLKEWWRHLVFQTIMFQLDIIFWKGRFLQWFSNLRARFHLGRTRKGGGGFEEELEKSMRRFAQDNLGIEVNSDMFVG
jgi:aarF domain-containing kinase